MIKKSIVIMLFILSFLTSCGEILTEDETSTTTDDSQIYIIGGLSGPSIASTVEKIDVYNPVTSTWYSNVAANATGTYVPTSFSAVVSYNSKIYVLGGFNNEGTVVGTTQIYDIETNSWSNGDPMPNARANHSAVVIDGKIYVSRGTTGNYNATWTVAGAPAYTLIYNIASNSWSYTTNSDPAYSNASAVAVNDIMYILGGKSAYATPVNVVTGIDTSYSNQATGYTEVVLAPSRVGCSALSYEESSGIQNILVIGGFSAIGCGNYCYTLQTISSGTLVSTGSLQYLRYPYFSPSAWTSAGNLTGLAFGSAVICNSKIYYFGGTSYPVIAQNVMYSYDLTQFPSGTWTNNGSVMPVARFGHTALIINQ